MSADEETQDLSLTGAERVVLATRPHPKVLARPALAVVVLVPTASFLLGRVPEGGAQAALRLIVGGLALALVALVAGQPLVRWATTSYELTDRRLLVREGLRRRPVRHLELDRVTRVRAATGGLADRLLRCGTLVVDSAYDGRRLLLHDVPDVAEVQRRVAELAPRRV